MKRKPLPINIVLRDIAQYGQRTPLPYALWVEGIEAEAGMLRGLLARWLDNHYANWPSAPPADLVRETEALRLPPTGKGDPDYRPDWYL